MKIICFNGSPKGAKSNTNVMAAEFLAGAQQAGAETENILLAEKDIKSCKGCFYCWLKKPGECCIADDMKGLLEKITQADMIVYATPLYIDNVSGIMKNFMDRIIPLADPHFYKEDGECRHPARADNKRKLKLAVISNSGFPELSHFQVISLLFNRIARNMGAELVAEIYKPGGALLSEHPFFLKPFIWTYKSRLKKAGEEVVRNGRLSDETRKKLEKPLIAEDIYIREANKYFDKMLQSAADPAAKK